MSNKTEDLQIFKDKVIKITLHEGSNEEYNYDWSEIVFTYENGEEELVSRMATDTNSPEDNSLSRIGMHNIQKVIQATEINPQVIYEHKRHKNSCGYF